MVNIILELCTYKVQMSESVFARVKVNIRYFVLLIHNYYKLYFNHKCWVRTRSVEDVKNTISARTYYNNMQIGTTLFVYGEQWSTVTLNPRDNKINGKS